MSAISNRINNLPNEIFDSHIIPLLLDVKNTDSLATLNLVCKEWNQTMKRETPYKAKMKEPNFFQKFPRMRLCELNSRSFRDAYLSYFPKSLWGKMELAYAECQTNTTDFAARMIVPLVACCPLLGPQITERLGMMPGLWDASMLLSYIPANLNFQDVRMNLLPAIITGASLVLLSSIDLMLAVCKYASPTLHSAYDHPVCQGLELPRGLANFTFITFGVFQLSHPGDSLLSKTYRVGKASLAASIPIAKTAYSKMKKSVAWIYNKLHPGT